MKLGTAIISFNRPQYLEQTLKSLEKQTDKLPVKYHLFQDGAVNKFSHKLRSEPYLLKSCVNLFNNAKLEHKKTHIQEMNVGNGINQFQAVEYMANNYEYFLIVEDDVILGKDYLKLIRVMIDQFMKREEVFSVSLNFKRMCNKKFIEQNLNKAGYISLHWWAECWSSKKWQKVKPYFMQYYEYIKNIDYVNRPAKEIVKSFHKHGLMIPQSSQDAGKDYALHRAKMKRINTIVNRAYYIGEKGLHFSVNKYKQMGYKEQVPYEFESDSQLEKFSLIKN
jgi:hypothetical protein